MNLTRDKELEYAKENGIKISDIAKKYSIDENIWGRAIEGGSLENLENEPPEDCFKFVKQDISSPGYVTSGFEKGIPVSLDGRRMDAELVVNELNLKAGSYGVGIIDHIEDRVVGIKSREVYESPAGLLLIEAHKDLEKMVLTNNELRFKLHVDDQWAWLAYSGLWVDPLLEDLNSFIDKTQQRVDGEIKIKMHNGSYRVVGRKSMYSLYDNNTVTYTSSSVFDQRLATGFVNLWGLQSFCCKFKNIGKQGVKMVKIDILYDKLRFEEKSLYNTAISRGIDVRLVDSKNLILNTDDVDSDETKFGDVLLQRSVSHFRGQYVTYCLEMCGYDVINDSKIGEVCGNKLLTSLILKKNNIPTPRSYFSFNSDSALNFINSVNLDKDPVVFKPVIGSWGRGVFPVRNREIGKIIVEMRQESHESFFKHFLFSGVNS